MYNLSTCKHLQERRKILYIILLLEVKWTFILLNYVVVFFKVNTGEEFKQCLNNTGYFPTEQDKTEQLKM